MELILGGVYTNTKKFPPPLPFSESHIKNPTPGFGPQILKKKSNTVSITTIKKNVLIFFCFIHKIPHTHTHTPAFTNASISFSFVCSFIFPFIFYYTVRKTCLEKLSEKTVKTINFPYFFFEKKDSGDCTTVATQPRQLHYSNNLSKNMMTSSRYKGSLRNTPSFQEP